MQTATTILNTYQARGQERKPLRRVYQTLINPDLFQRAYAKIASNKGALTPGVTDETADGWSEERQARILSALQAERYRWSPSRRVYIPKPDGKRRALGLPTWSDKILQEVIRSLLEAYYEPQFSGHSHGFRPNRSTGTALTDIQHSWKGTKWWIEGDIKSYFDTIDHDLLLHILSLNIQDNRFLTLLRRFVAAGYMEDWTRVPNHTGTPQGGVLSPLLSNIYLHELDHFVEHTLIPQYTRGKLRGIYPPYGKLTKRIASHRKAGRGHEAHILNKERRSLPSRDPHDPNYRRLRYTRYADDFLLGFSGPRSEALIIRDELSSFLAETLNLELNEDKTLITHAGSQPAKYLGYHLQVQYTDSRLTNGRRTTNGYIGLRIPPSVFTTHRRNYTRKGKPHHNPLLLYHSDYYIVNWYQERLRGLAQYYLSLGT